jgi:hypothetical protein
MEERECAEETKTAGSGVVALGAIMASLSAQVGLFGDLLAVMLATLLALVPKRQYHVIRIGRKGKGRINIAS